MRRYLGPSHLRHIYFLLVELFSSHSAKPQCSSPQLDFAMLKWSHRRKKPSIHTTSKAYTPRNVLPSKATKLSIRIYMLVSQKKPPGNSEGTNAHERTRGRKKGLVVRGHYIHIIYNIPQELVCTSGSSRGRQDRS